MYTQGLILVAAALVAAPVRGEGLVVVALRRGDVVDEDRVAPGGLRARARGQTSP